MDAGTHRGDAGSRARAMPAAIVTGWTFGFASNGRRRTRVPRTAVSPTARKARASTRQGAQGSRPSGRELGGPCESDPETSAPGRGARARKGGAERSRGDRPSGRRGVITTHRLAGLQRARRRRTKSCLGLVPEHQGRPSGRGIPSSTSRPRAGFGSLRPLQVEWRTFGLAGAFGLHAAGFGPLPESRLRLRARYGSTSGHTLRAVRNLPRQGPVRGGGRRAAGCAGPQPGFAADGASFRFTEVEQRTAWRRKPPFAPSALGTLEVEPSSAANVGQHSGAKAPETSGSTGWSNAPLQGGPDRWS